MTASLPAISDLRDQPEFAGTIADRVWQAWWREQGVALCEIEAMVRECMDGPDIPLSLVAHEGPDFHGCAHLIASDLDERPQYTPWIAAVWVEKKARKGGLGTKLVLAAVEEGFSRGFDAVYLCAEPHLAPFYEKMGWRCIEEGVAGLSVFSISR
ncbi:GNAT family N-acetyltransferase [Aquamicrobium sp.]|uniref:GNAT family N-acetyltransferase n=1 Tax=Aquamicrobium sp. TaxID=1872579 RepID=UPI0025858DE0|nr:GNAT family N-acetyltransferase [Aquamicrobium sp.]MCK9552843.1 GNAT family N-acetyltransferase [Aquamicrobium sp.]